MHGPREIEKGNVHPTSPCPNPGGPSHSRRRPRQHRGCPRPGGRAFSSCWGVSVPTDFEQKQRFSFGRHTRAKNTAHNALSKGHTTFVQATEPTASCRPGGTTMETTFSVATRRHPEQAAAALSSANQSALMNTQPTTSPRASHPGAWGASIGHPPAFMLHPETVFPKRRIRRVTGMPATQRGSSCVYAVCIEVTFRTTHARVNKKVH